MHTLLLPTMTIDAQTDAQPPIPTASGAPTTLPAIAVAPTAPTVPFHLSGQQLQFLLRVAPLAVACQKSCGIPACVTIAQAILESATPEYGWGSSELFRLANNPFGIRYFHFSDNSPGPGGGPSAQGPAAQAAGSAKALQTHPAGAGTPADYGHFDVVTWEIDHGQKKVVTAEFQRFPNLAEAFRAYALLLRGPRYRAAFEVRADWQQFAARLGPKTSPQDAGHCGYSTNPGYPAELVKLIVMYRLNDPRALAWLATGEDPGHPAEARGTDSATNSFYRRWI